MIGKTQETFGVCRLPGVCVLGVTRECVAIRGQQDWIMGLGLVPESRLAALCWGDGYPPQFCPGFAHSLLKQSGAKAELFFFFFFKVFVWASRLLVNYADVSSVMEGSLVTSSAAYQFLSS